MMAHELGRIFSRVSAAILCTASILAGLSPFAEAQGSALKWTGTWATSPVRDNSGKEFNQQTLRQIVHTSIGGNSARIQVSNVFGTQPLTIADVHMAQTNAGPSIVTDTDRPVYFGGLGTVTLPPGTTIVSDPIDFQVHSLADISISMYLPKATGPITYHPSGFQTNYIAEGDMSSKATLSQAKATQSYYFLTDVDIQGQDVSGAVVTFGASITDGYRSLSDTNRRWPNDLAKRLVDAGMNVGVLNQGISGNRLLLPGAGESAETRFDRDLLAQPGVRWVIFSDDPINDLGTTRDPDAGGKLIAAMERLIARAHASGIKFYCSTLTPYQGAGYWTASGEAAREQINAFIRSHASGCDAVIDQDAATHDPARPARYLPAFDSGDHLHPNTAGLQAIADAVDLALFLAGHDAQDHGQTSIQTTAPVR